MMRMGVFLKYSSPRIMPQISKPFGWGIIRSRMKKSGLLEAAVALVIDPGTTW